jgi:uncharacterized membrane protein YsdA (DUF1294 family)
MLQWRVHEFMGYGYVAAVFALPFLAGFLHHRNWKACAAWSFCIASVVSFWFVGAEITEARFHEYGIDESDMLLTAVKHVLLPSIGATFSGIAVGTLIFRIFKNNAEATI